MNQTATLALPAPITGASAWRGEDLQQHPESWTDPLDEPFISALSDRIDGFLASNRPLADMVRGDLEHPVLTARTRDWCNTLLSGRGFVLARGLPVHE